MRIALDDATIDVESVGYGEAIVLLHGFPVTRAVWDAQAPVLAASARVVCPDLRGMGRSSVPEGPYLMETLAGDVAGVLDALQIERASFVGHSLGGYVAMAFARMYAERVRRLVLVCSRLAADSPETARVREDLADRIEREGRVDAALDAYLPRLLAAQTLERRPEIVARVRKIGLENAPRGIAGMLRGIAQRAASDDIAQELTMPVLILAGRYDAVVPPGEARAMASIFPNASVAFMEGSGHLPMLEEPGSTAAAIAGFLAAG
ncbi:MAG: alpha/beta fold hydrolase [Vulcanimicrobiaceae bacterium]